MFWEALPRIDKALSNPFLWASRYFGDFPKRPEKHVKSGKPCMTSCSILYTLALFCARAKWGAKLLFGSFSSQRLPLRPQLAKKPGTLITYAKIYLKKQNMGIVFPTFCEISPKVLPQLRLFKNPPTNKWHVPWPHLGSISWQPPYHSSWYLRRLEPTPRGFLIFSRFSPAHTHTFFSRKGQEVKKHRCVLLRNNNNKKSTWYCLRNIMSLKPIISKKNDCKNTTTFLNRIPSSHHPISFNTRYLDRIPTTSPCLGPENSWWWTGGLRWPGSRING